MDSETKTPSQSDNPNSPGSLPVGPPIAPAAGVPPSQPAAFQPSPPPAPAAPAPVVNPALDPFSVGATKIDDTPLPPPNTLETVADGFRSVLGAIFSWIVFPIVVVLILHNFIFQAYHVLGSSMVPTLHETDYLIISKVGNTTNMLERLMGQNATYIPARGQVIVFHYPKNPTQVFVKRVVGLPGDHLVIKNGQVTIFNKANPNGFNPDVSYESKDTATLIDTDEVVQDGNVFVLGDNRTPNGSYDSREWGELPSSYIVGNAVLRLLPLDQVRIF